MNLTPEQMLKLARIVYSEVDVIKNTIVVHKDYTWIRFEPSLIGSDEQQLQAIHIIEYADNRSNTRHEFRQKLYSTSHDLLTAAALALLSRCLSRRNNLWQKL